jgi:hypothetical protein
VVTRDHLPLRLDVDIWTRITSETTCHSLYSATYRDRGGSGAITGAF